MHWVFFGCPFYVICFSFDMLSQLQQETHIGSKQHRVNTSPQDWFIKEKHFNLTMGVWQSDQKELNDGGYLGHTTQNSPPFPNNHKNSA